MFEARAMCAFQNRRQIMIERATSEQIFQLTERFGAAIQRLPKVMAESWLENPQAFRVNVRETVFAQMPPDRGAIFEKTRLAKFRRHLKGQLCRHCKRPMSGLIRFTPYEEGWSLYGFPMRQKVWVICGTCGQAMDASLFNYRETKHNFSKAFKDVRKAWKNLAPLMDWLEPESNNPPWMTTLREAIEKIRTDFLEADIVIYNPGTTAGELDEIYLGNVLAVLKETPADDFGGDRFIPLRRFKHAYVHWMN
jgi:hypothetical protein